MKRMALWMIGLYCLLAAMLGVIYLCGPLLSESASARLFGLKRCSVPCLMGVTLGQTTYLQARASLAERAVPPGYTRQLKEKQISSDEHSLELVWSDGSDENLRAYFIFDQHNVARLMSFGRGTFSHRSELMPTFGEIVVLYGHNPDCAFLDGGSAGDYFDLPIRDKEHAWSVNVQGHSLDWTTAATAISFAYYPDQPELSSGCGQCGWQGVTHWNTFLGCNVR